MQDLRAHSKVEVVRRPKRHRGDFSIECLERQVLTLIDEPHAVVENTVAEQIKEEE